MVNYQFKSYIHSYAFGLFSLSLLAHPSIGLELDWINRIINPFGDRPVKACGSSVLSRLSNLSLSSLCKGYMSLADVNFLPIISRFLDTQVYFPFLFCTSAIAFFFLFCLVLVWVTSAAFLKPALQAYLSNTDSSSSQNWTIPFHITWALKSTNVFLASWRRASFRVQMQNYSIF